jgi:hypothetical protein
MAILEAVFANKAGQTPQEVERRRRMAQALVEAGSGGKPPSSGLELAGRLAMTLSGQYQAGKAERQDATNRANANSLLAKTLLGEDPYSPASSGASGSPIPMTGAANEVQGPRSASVTPGGNPDVSDYIRQGAIARGMDPNIVLRVAGHEGLNVFDPSKPDQGGDEGSSFGPFQLHYAGRSKSMPNPGLGDEFTKATGLHASDPSTWKQQIDFSLDWARKHGWSPWMGAKAEGITGMMGINGTPPQQPAQVASLDPGVGMPAAAEEMQRTAPASGYVDPRVTTEGRAPMQGPTQPAPALPPPSIVASAPPVASVPQQPASLMSSPVPGPSPAAPQMMAQTSPSKRAQIAALLQNPYTQELGQQMLMQEYGQQQEEQKWRAREDYKLNSQRADPSYKLEQDYKQAQLDALRAKTGKRANVTNLGDGWLYDNDEGKAFRPQDEVAKPNGSGFRFGGNSVEAQSLNGLIESGQITEGQAQQLGAGKTITDPSTGSMMFLTPQGIFKQQQGQQAAPVDQSQSPINLFGDSGNAPAQNPAAAPIPAAPGSVQNASVPQANDSVSAGNPGIIPLTGGKPQKLLSEAERKNQSLFSVIKPELQVVEDNFDALSDPKNQAFSRMPFSEFATTPEYQKAANSLQTIVSSYLYSVSGATATPEEVRKQTDILTPRPGESKDSIENKKKRVRTMVNAVAQAGSLPPMEEPAAAPPPPEDLSSMPVPDGMDANVWKFVPPEDRKLWLKK